MSELKSKKITDAEYCAVYQPVGVWLLVEKDAIKTKTDSGIILSYKEESVGAALKGSATGVIRAMSPKLWQSFEQSHDAYWHRMFRVGDRVGFSSSTPITAPLPQQLGFDIGDHVSMKWAQLTVTDITGIFLLTKAAREEWLSRFDDANEMRS